MTSGSGLPPGGGWEPSRQQDLGLLRLLRSDWDANRGNLKGRIVTALFRVTHAVRSQSHLPWFVWTPCVMAYRLVTECGFGIELRSGATIGPGLRLDHGTGLVIHDDASIGANALLRHNVTVGASEPGGGCPVVGDDVEFGVGAVVVGPIHIGDHVHIGANAVVTHDVPAHHVVRAPASIIRSRQA